MDLTGLLPLLREDSGFRRVAEHGRAPYLTATVPLGARPALLAALAGAPQGSETSEGEPPVLAVVTATTRDAEDLAAAMSSYLPSDLIAVFPAWETLPHERLSPRADTVARRLAVLRRLSHPDVSRAATAMPRVVVMPIRALLQPIAKRLGDLPPVSLQVGREYPMERVVADLAAAAYTRVDMVERRGEFAVRGGLLDIFPPTEAHPLRVEFFGDDVEGIRAFAVADQRSLEPVDAVWAPPARELLLTEAVRERARELTATMPGLTDMLDRIAEGIAVEGMEALTPALVDGMECVLDAFPESTRVVLSDPERIRRRAEDLTATTAEFLAAAWTSASAGGTVPVRIDEASFVELAEARALAHTRGFDWWQMTALTALPDEDDTSIHVGAREVRPYRGDIPAAIKDIQGLIRDGWRIVLTTEGPGPGRRMAEQFAGVDVPAAVESGVPGELRSGVVTITTSRSGPGFVFEGLKLAVVTEADITGRAGTSSTRDMRTMPKRRKNVVDPLALRPGDHVVHEHHGVGRFVELVQRTVGKGAAATTREYMVIEYASSKRGAGYDRLYVPTDSLDQVTKYTGGESPALNKMGGSDWTKTKSRARKAVREIAAELIRLYAARMATQGHAFSPDTPWQRELEDAFPYVETPDQLVTIDEVKGDMERTTPMDRLISGDVGYGKTEIAVRAAFKAVQDGKQVAVLVPTTLLVQQHMETFAERYAGFPITVRALSRFQTKAEAQATRDGIARGAVDVVIGTHSLITGEVRFKDLGLVIVDEEQRFGVEHKETLKQMRTNVDVLAMSATPIPRTLEMAVTGIREMSTLATPPEERHPILTFVGPNEDRQVAAAIRRELLRDGQVFYVHNRVQSIEKTAAHLNELVPEARIAIAHGKMNEHQLERVIVDFWNREFDVLVCTTIVETGLDISNANTLIVERADTFGLSQLHQLRGRVGRGRERAYAYFLYPPERALTEAAHDRLQTIAAHTDLGAGMQVALKDLEIRGAGNLLGGEQSGHIAGVGFDLYVRMVSEAVAQFRDDAEPERADVRIELPVNAHVPHEYIGHERLRLEAYSKIAAAKDDADLAAIRAELSDRYGEVPEPVERLFDVARVRAHARELGLEEISAQGKYLRIAPFEVKDSVQVRLKRLYPGTIVKGAVRAVLVPLPRAGGLGAGTVTDGALLEWLERLLTALAAPVPSAAS